MVLNVRGLSSFSRAGKSDPYVSFYLEQVSWNHRWSRVRTQRKEKDTEEGVHFILFPYRTTSFWIVASENRIHPKRKTTVRPYTARHSRGISQPWTTCKMVSHASNRGSAFTMCKFTPQLTLFGCHDRHFVQPNAGSFGSRFWTLTLASTNPLEKAMWTWNISNQTALSKKLIFVWITIWSSVMRWCI